MSHRPFLKDFFTALAAWALLAAGISALAQPAPDQSASPTKAEIRHADGRYQLYVNGRPFYVKGAGLESGNLKILSENGGNSLRTWRTRNAQHVLDDAQKNGLYVTMGIDVGLERHGFDYNDTNAVARQLADIKKQVLKYKDHPALIIWAIGNELNFNSTNAKVWDAVNGISKMIHEVDPNHLTLTPLAGISPVLIRDIKSHAPDLDLIGIQMYADIINLPRHLRESDWTGPYIVTEWGATGHWEVPKTDWGAPLENNSTLKSELCQKRYETAIAADKMQCLGSYVFLWGSKQERTPTWYGLFLESGDETATVDVLRYLWKNEWPSNRCPRLEEEWLDGKTAQQNIHLHPGQTYNAKVLVKDEISQPLIYSWQIMGESAASSVGGDAEGRPKVLTNLIADPAEEKIVLRAPTKPGAYRLFVYAYDGKGHAAHANIPFYVN